MVELASRASFRARGGFIDIDVWNELASCGEPGSSGSEPSSCSLLPPNELALLFSEEFYALTNRTPFATHRKHQVCAIVT